jgi:hypothetical protein
MQLPSAFIPTAIPRACVGAHCDARNAARSRPHRLHLVVWTLEPLVRSASTPHLVQKPRNFTTIPPTSTQHSYISLLLTHPHASQRVFTHLRTLPHLFTRPNRSLFPHIESCQSVYRARTLRQPVATPHESHPARRNAFSSRRSYRHVRLIIMRSARPTSSDRIQLRRKASRPLLPHGS